MASASTSLSSISCKSGVEVSSFSWVGYTPSTVCALWNGEERTWMGSQHYLQWLRFRGSVNSHMLLVKYFQYVQRCSFFLVSICIFHEMLKLVHNTKHLIKQYTLVICAAHQGFLDLICYLGHYSRRRSGGQVPVSGSLFLLSFSNVNWTVVMSMVS